MPLEADQALRGLARELNWEGVITESDLDAFINCCLDALEVHLDRERARHGLWKDYPAIDQVRQIKIKAERVMNTLEPVREGKMSEQEYESMLEEYPDIINYAIFAWRIERGTV